MWTERAFYLRKITVRSVKREVEVPQPLAELAKEPLEWKCVGITDASWDLYAGASLIGALRLGAMRMSGTAEIAPGRWKIFRMGLFGSVHVSAEGARTEAAKFSKKWYRGRVKLETGQELEWGPTNFWATRWAWTGENGQPAVEFRRKGWLGRANMALVAPEARAMGELPVLLILGQFLMIRRAQAH